ncbi:MAG: hypothetical protein ACJ73S_01425 [Mycobacteriales bacterium]
MTDNTTEEMAESGAPTAAELAAVANLVDLAKCMRRLHHADGRTPLRELESWGVGHNRPMPRATLNDALVGKRPPSMRLLQNFLASMRLRDESAVRPWLEALDRVSSARPGGQAHSYADRELGPAAAHKFFVEKDKVDEISRLIKNVQEQVWLLGTTLSMHVPYVQPALQHAVANNRNVRILLIKPGGAAMDMSVLRAGPKGLGRHEQEQHLNTNLAILWRLARFGPNVEVRLIDYLAPYTLYAYDPGMDSGMMQMRLGSFHGDHYLRPTFRVDRSRDEVWFEYFYEQFVSMWNAADPYDLGAEVSDE